MFFKLNLILNLVYYQIAFFIIEEGDSFKTAEELKNAIKREFSSRQGFKNSHQFFTEVLKTTKKLREIVS
jgi:hypothetical protein